MSTRANIIIKNSNTQLFFYRHSDGYPDCTGEDLKEFCSGYTQNKMRTNPSQSAGWLIIRGHEEYADSRQKYDFSRWKVGAYEPADGLYADIDYLYVIDLDAQVLETRQIVGNFWEEPSIEKTRVVKTHSFAQTKEVSNVG